MPAGDDCEAVRVPADTVYLRSRSGGRKASGSYYTPQLVVRHVVNEALIPAHDAHLAEVLKLIDAGDEERAANELWAFRVCDPAMGSGHFLVRDLIAEIPETAWITIDDYPDTGEAQIAETLLSGRRLIVRRTRLVGAQAELFPDWRHFALATNRSEDIAIVEAEHRQHAVVELVIRDLKDQALAHFPSGQFHANGAWTVIAAITHNLLRWTELLGHAGHIIRAARTIRRRLLALPGRLTSHAARWTLHLPARWPWQHDFTQALKRIRALPAAA